MQFTHSRKQIEESITQQVSKLNHIVFGFKQRHYTFSSFFLFISILHKHYNIILYSLKINDSHVVQHPVTQSGSILKLVNSLLAKMMHIQTW